MAANINQLQERYAQLVDLRLRASLVTSDTGANAVFNTKYEGSPKAGAVKIPVRDAEVSVGDYNRTSGINATTSETSYLTVTNFKDQAINELIDGYEAAAVPDNIVADRLDSAGYMGSRILDIDGLDTLARQGTMNPDTTPTISTNVYDRIVDAGEALSNANIPTQGRWVIVTPHVYAQMLKDTSNFIRQGDLAQNLVQQGYVGLYSGFAVKQSNLMPTGVEFICGHMDWCHRIREWVVAPHIQDLNGDGKHIGASAVQGRWIYKHAVSKAAAVYVKFLATLALTSVAGATTGKTAITVLPALTEGNTYAYKVAANFTSLPQYGSTPVAYTAWNGTDDITAATDQKIVVVELAADGTVAKAGMATVVAHA